MDSERTTGKRQNEGEESRNETKESRDLRRQERRGEERKENEIFFFFSEGNVRADPDVEENK